MTSDHPLLGTPLGKSRGLGKKEHRQAGQWAPGLSLKDRGTQPPCSQAPPPIPARQVGKSEVQGQVQPSTAPPGGRARPPIPTKAGLRRSMGYHAFDRWPSSFLPGPAAPGAPAPSSLSLSKASTGKIQHPPQQQLESVQYQPPIHAVKHSHPPNCQQSSLWPALGPATLPYGVQTHSTNLTGPGSGQAGRTFRAGGSNVHSGKQKPGVPRHTFYRPCFFPFQTTNNLMQRDTPLPPRSSSLTVHTPAP